MDDKAQTTERHCSKKRIYLQAARYVEQLDDVPRGDALWHELAEWVRANPQNLKAYSQALSTQDAVDWAPIGVRVQDINGRIRWVAVSPPRARARRGLHNGLPVYCRGQEGRALLSDSTWL